MSEVVSVVNMKGGVGKSTITANLAWQFAGYTNWNKKVLVVDLDPQFNVSQYLLGVKKYEDQVFNPNAPTTWDIFEQYSRTPGTKAKHLNLNEIVQNVVNFRDGSKIDLIPSRLELAFSLKNPSQKEHLLSDLLSDIKANYDLILIDCPPTESLFTVAAYVSSDHVLVPVKPEFLSTVGLPLLAQSLHDFNSQYHTNLEILGIVFNSTYGNTPEERNSKRDVASIAENNKWYLFKNAIKFSRSYPRGSREGNPIFWTQYARTNVAKEFHEFALEFGNRIGF